MNIDRPNFKNFLIVLLLGIIFLSYFLKPSFVEPDSYYFYNVTCNLSTIVNTPILAEIIYNILPCNIILLKLLLFGLALASIYWLKKAGELISTQWGWLAPIFFLASPAFTEFLKLEDDQLSYPLIFASIYYSIKYLKYNNKFDLLISIGTTLIAGLFWKGAIYFLINTLIISPFYLLIPFMVFIQPEIITNLIPAFNVWEQYPLIGLASTFIFIIGYYAIKTLWKQTTLWTIITSLRAKFFPFLTIYLTILSTKVFERFTNLQKKAFIILIGIMFFSNIISIQTLPMNQDQIKAINELLKISKETNQTYENDLVFGYYMQSIGEKPSNTAGQYDLNYYQTKGLKLTTFELENCTLLKNYSTNYIYQC